MRVEVDGGARGVLRHPVAVVDVVGDVLSRLLVQQLPVSERGLHFGQLESDRWHFLCQILAPCKDFFLRKLTLSTVSPRPVS